MFIILRKVYSQLAYCIINIEFEQKTAITITTVPQSTKRIKQRKRLSRSIL